MYGGANIDWTWGWTAIGAIATCILALSIFFAIWQIRETRRSTNTQLKAARLSTNAHVAIEMFGELRSADNLNLLRYIYSLRPEHLKSLTKRQGSDIERAIGRINMLGILVAKDVIDEMLAAESLAGPTALRCWYQLYSYVRETRKSRGSYFYEYFEDFVRRCLEYFINSGRSVWFSREGEEDIRVDVIEELHKEELYPRTLDQIRREK